ncbi:Uma2 family endonuclease [Spiractinospora alimapuensis]|nr:Uma2 family endonuclease [Spiractinospora alimapuensis]
MVPPRAEGWFAEDLDHLPDSPPHTELLDGHLVWPRSPQRLWHARVTRRLTNALHRCAPDGLVAEQRMTVVLDPRNRPEPDVLVATHDDDFTITSFPADQVHLAVEVVSPESAHRDRHVKPAKYAAAGIPHFWRVEEEDGSPVAHVYERDTTTGGYAPTGVYRDTLRLDRPFAIELELSGLTARRGTR